MHLDFPPLLLLKYKFDDLNELWRLEKEIGVTQSIKEAELVLVHDKAKLVKGIQHELRKLNVWTEIITNSDHIESDDEYQQPVPTKRRKVEKNSDGKHVIDLDSSTESDTDPESKNRSQASSATLSPGTSLAYRSKPTASYVLPKRDETVIRVIKVSWYFDSVDARKLLPVGPYMVFEGRVIPNPSAQKTVTYKKPDTSSVLSSITPFSEQSGYKHKRGHPGGQSSQSKQKPPHLLKESTSDNEWNGQLPPLPEYMKSHYSCQRPTPRLTKNDEFITQLRIIKEARMVTDAENENTSKFSAKSYSGVISVVAAYPHTLRTNQELLRLPGVGQSAVHHFEEWKTTGRIQEVERIKYDEKITILHTFWNIYDVGPKIARDWYNRGWKDLDDVAENFDRLTRAQQLGVKYYEQFEEKIPRNEVERIGNIVLDHANKIQPGFQMVLCGSYRRGKPYSGDVDIILSHPDEDATLGFIEEIWDALQVDKDADTGELVKRNYITHTLRFTKRNSERNQEPLLWKGETRTETGKKAGFDTLDKIFVIWQDKNWPSMAEDLERDPQAKNPNIHRRVDIIISPWKTAGCAIVGWTGGNMFERDLRRYCKVQLGYKFDSSGVRRRDDGMWVDLEAGANTLLEKEKKVFEGLNLPWFEPTMRCTD